MARQPVERSVGLSNDSAPAQIARTARIWSRKVLAATVRCHGTRADRLVFDGESRTGTAPEPSRDAHVRAQRLQRVDRLASCTGWRL